MKLGLSSDPLGISTELFEYILDKINDPNCQYLSTKQPLAIQNEVTHLESPIVFLESLLGERHPFSIGPKLGESNNKVKIAKDLITGEEVALKIVKSSHSDITKEKALREEQREVNALINFNRFRGMAVRDYPNGEMKKYIAQSLVDGKDLERYLKQKIEKMQQTCEIEEYKKCFSEVIDIAYQFCKAVEHCHNEDYIHRDIKPANMIISTIDENQTRLSLIDFGGMIKETDIDSDIDTDYGTKRFRAPELPRDKHSRLSDVYSTGKSLEVILEILTIGQFPRVRHTKNSHNERPYKAIYDQMLTLIQSLTQIDAKERISMKDALNRFEKIAKDFPGQLPDLNRSIRLDNKNLDHIESHHLKTHYILPEL